MHVGYISTWWWWGFAILKRKLCPLHTVQCQCDFSGQYWMKWFSHNYLHCCKKTAKHCDSQPLPFQNYHATGLVCSPWQIRGELPTGKPRHNVEKGRAGEEGRKEILLRAETKAKGTHRLETHSRTMPAAEYIHKPDEIFQSTLASREGKWLCQELCFCWGGGGCICCATVTTCNSILLLKWLWFTPDCLNFNQKPRAEREKKNPS